MADEVSFGPLLRERRLAAGLTQEALADRAGLSPRGIQKLERGGAKPQAETVRRLARALALAAAERAQFEAAAMITHGPRRPHAHAQRHAWQSFPAQASSFVGREREAAEVRRLLGTHRLVTLTGTGGVGKTRLALRAAADPLDAFADGARFVPLAPVTDPDMVIPTIAHALDIVAIGGRPVSELVRDSLRDKALLLLLDNFEHVLPAAVLVGELLAACPKLHVVATSRAALRLYGEQEYEVLPLALPDSWQPLSSEQIGRSEAVALFVERARAVRLGFAVTDENATTVAAICRRLDGLPLAIELAAARLRLLPPEALLARLERTLPLLTSGPRDAPLRQRTLRDTIAWSYHLLREPQRELFRRLGVFVGGWPLDAAAAVCGRDGAAADGFDDIAALVEHCLVLRDAPTDGEPRFTMLETIHEYALERLAEWREEDPTRERHAAYYERLDELAERQFSGPRQRAWLDRLEREHDNFRAALRWHLDTGHVERGLRLAGSLQSLWYRGGHIAEGFTWYSRLLAEPRLGTAAYAAARARALVWAGIFAASLGNADPATALLEEGLALARELGDDAAIATSLTALAHVIRDAGDDAAARSLLEEAVASSRRLADPFIIARSLAYLGSVVVRQGEYAEASALLEESLATSQALGNEQGMADALEDLGLISEALGDDRLARSRWEESLALYRDSGDRGGMATVHNYLGHLDCRCGRYDAARDHFVMSLDLMRASRATASISQSLHGLAALAAAQGRPERALRLAGASAPCATPIQAARPPSSPTYGSAISRRPAARSMRSQRRSSRRKAGRCPWTTRSRTPLRTTWCEVRVLTTLIPFGCTELLNGEERAVKNQYDPTNLIRLNQNVKPTV